MRYTYNSVEDYVNKMYKAIGVYHSRQLVIKTIAARLGLTIIYVRMESTHYGNVIYLDNRLTDSEQWQDFGHELCHVLWHAGNQLVMPPLYRDYQEWKAFNFGMHVCVPTFMLDNMSFPRDFEGAVLLVQETFNVTYEFAEMRLGKFVQQKESRTIYIKAFGF